MREINRLLARLRRMTEAERERVADAAHELLTPLAAVQAQAYELVESTDESTSSRAADELERGLQRVSTLIRQLLLLARSPLENAGETARVQNLIPDLQERVARALARALAKRIEISLEAPAELRARFHRELLMTALDNLLDNAIHYCPPGSQISVRLARVESGIESQRGEIR